MQLTSGLVRLVDFNNKGIAMALAHCIGISYAGQPGSRTGYSAASCADRYAFRDVAAKIWVGDPAIQYINEAIKQWEKLFGLVDPQNAKGNPLDPLNDSSLDCSLKVIVSAPFGGRLPECTGGTPNVSIE